MRILHIDIETTPAQVFVWALHKQDISVDQIIRPTSVLCFSAKWDGEEEVMFYKADKQSGVEFDKMIRAAHRLLSEADAVCHFNGTTFDIPRLNQEFLRLGLPPPPPIPQIDLKKVVMNKFSMVSSKLAFVGPYLKIGEKIRNEGWPLWIGCLDGDPNSWKAMETYNKGDVILLEKLYHKVLPWIEQHPNRGLFINTDKPACPRCGSVSLQSRGVQRGATLTYRRFQCKNCGGWCRARCADKLGKAEVR